MSWTLGEILARLDDTLKTVSDLTLAPDLSDQTALPPETRKDRSYTIVPAGFTMTASSGRCIEVREDLSIRALYVSPLRLTQEALRSFVGTDRDRMVTSILALPFVSGSISGRVGITGDGLTIEIVLTVPVVYERPALGGD